MKILVVDDMPLMRHVLINMLRQLKFDDIVEATDGQQAFQLLEKGSYQLLITDLNMPKMDGHCLLSKIRASDSLNQLPVLIVTCEDSKEKVQQVIKQKVNGFIIKPFCLTTLKNQLKHILPNVKL